MKRLAYIGADSVRYRVLVPARKVYLYRAEGTNDLCRDWTFEDFFEADCRLRMNAVTAPKTGGYHKHDFEVTWADGQSYFGRYDLQGTEVSPSIQTHIWTGFIWMRDNPEAKKVFPADVHDAARTFLETYDLGRPVVAPNDWEVIADYTANGYTSGWFRRLQAEAYGLPLPGAC